jgi:hypothetical protein
MILFHNVSNDKKMKVITMICFCHILNDIGFPMKEKLLRTNLVFGSNAFQDPP